MEEDSYFVKVHHSIDHSAKDDFIPVRSSQIPKREIKLGVVSVLVVVAHGQDTRSRMAHLKILFLKGLAV